MFFNFNFDKYIYGFCVLIVYGNGLDSCYVYLIYLNFLNVFLKGLFMKFWNIVKLKIINESVIVMYCVFKGFEYGDDEGF